MFFFHFPTELLFAGGCKNEWQDQAIVVAQLGKLEKSICPVCDTYILYTK